MCGGIASCYFNHLVTLFKQKQSPSACISLKTKDCFMFSVLLLRLFFFFCKIMHYAIMNNCSFCCIIGIFGTIGTKVFKPQDWFTEINFHSRRTATCISFFTFLPLRSLHLIGVWMMSIWSGARSGWRWKLFKPFTIRRFRGNHLE